jgi:hypothetical protein
MNVTLPTDQLAMCDDLAWAKPYVEEARASVSRGEVSSGEDFLKWLDARLEALRLR